MKGVAKDQEKKPRARIVHSASEKCRAVLSLWAERRKPLELCREMGIQWMRLNQWQDRALEGMLKALEPKIRTDAPRPAELGEKLQRLFEKKTGQQPDKLGKLSERLAKIQETQRQEQSSP